MLDEAITELFPREGHGAPNDRVPQAQLESGLPAGTRVFSADDHVSVGEDIFYQNLPDELKPRAPRLWRGDDGVFQIGIEMGVSILPEGFSEVVSFFEKRPGCDAANQQARLADMDEEGISCSLVFPNEVLGLLAWPDHEVKDACIRIYNEYIADWQARSKGRLYAVGLINWWDADGARASLEQLKSLGLRTFLMPLNGMTYPDGTKVDYTSERMDPVWTAIEESGLPVTHHIGEAAINLHEHNKLAIATLMHLNSFAELFGEYTLGGILDRHPGLKIGWFEGGISWVATMLQNVKFLKANFRHTFSWDMKKEPEEYWREHMFASFVIDPLGLELIDRIGPDQVFWSTDYPHNESSLGYSRSSIKNVVDIVGPDKAKSIVGANIEKYLGIQR